ncbi:hypothetical protein WH301_22170 [Brucella pseudogrignonensis]|nr:hypothetical protein [Brucella pseudogrignonensis]
MIDAPRLQQLLDEAKRLVITANQIVQDHHPLVFLLRLLQHLKQRTKASLWVPQLMLNMIRKLSLGGQRSIVLA